MKIVIVGAGTVGYSIAKRFSLEDVEISVIEQDGEKIRRLKESCDVFAIQGEGDAPEMLIEAGVTKADVVLAVTNQDAVNVLACYFAKILAPNCVTVARVRNTGYHQYDYFFNKAHLNIDHLINPEEITAETILKLIAIPGACEMSHFLEGRVKLLGFHVDQASPVVGQSLEKLFRNRTEGSILIMAIKRHGKLIIPRGKSEIRTNDILYFLAKQDGVSRACAILGYSKQTLTRIMIMGGGTYGRFIAQKLEEEGIQCKIIERNLKKCNELDAILTNTVVIHGDGTDEELLHQENVGKMDAFIAVTDNGPLNLVSASLAKKLGVKRVLSLTYKKALFNLSQEIGIDVCINPQFAVTNRVLQFIRKGGKILSVQTFSDEDAELQEFVVRENSPLVGKAIKDIDFPHKALVGIIEHEGKIMIPSGADVIYPGDRVIIFAAESAVSKVAKLLT